MIARPFSFFLLILMISHQLYFNRPAAADTYPNRLSFAISGGASMGAYEAGLIWGLIEAARQIEKISDRRSGGELRPIEFASIAGTSAGGINSLLAALAWSVNPENEGGFANRIDDNIFRDVWLVPDVNRLLPPDADASQYLPDDALLSRKDLVAAARDLRDKWRQPGTFRAGLRLPIGVTVTSVKPDTMMVSGVEVNNQRFYIPFELQTQKDGSAKFFFDPNDYASLSDPSMILMPWTVDGSPYFLSDQQVEDAILTTSAFPTGFGRKRLQYCRMLVSSSHGDSPAAPSAKAADYVEGKLVCPDGYQLMEAEFTDGGLFDNLPIGLARTLAETSRPHIEKPLPVKYIYLDPARQSYKTPQREDKRACDSENPPEACSRLAFNLASETVVLEGAIGTARKYELYRELTSKNWRLNLSRLSREMADVMDADHPDMRCDPLLPYFDDQMRCSDRLRHAGGLIELAYSYSSVPVFPPLSAQKLSKGRIADQCRPNSTGKTQGATANCTIDAQRLRKQLANVLRDLTAEIVSVQDKLSGDIQQSALSIDSDRSIKVTSRGAPITADLLDSFGAFLDYKFREFDYFVGTYDAIVNMVDSRCTSSFPLRAQQAQRETCRDQLGEHLYHLLGVAGNPKSRYLFALMAKNESGNESGFRYAYDPMPPEDRDIRIIYDGLNRSILSADEEFKDAGGSVSAEGGGNRIEQDGIGQSILAVDIDINQSGESVSTERRFFEHLKVEKFRPTPLPDGGKPLLTQIMDDPDYWTHELVNRATLRLVHLEKQAEEIYQAREPDPEKQEQANTALMGATALSVRTVTYKYPEFTFSPSTAPDSWFWRNIIPYEAALDLVEGDIQFFWQPTWNFKSINVGVRAGLGFAGGIFNSSRDKSRENYGTLGLDLTRNKKWAFLSGWGITPAVFHNWKEPEVGDQTSLGFEVHADLLKNRLRISLGARDIINNGADTLFLNIGIADLPGISYWLSR